MTSSLFRYAILFFYCVVIASAKTVTIQPGSTPGQALGKFQDVPNYKWTHKSTSKVFQAKGFEDMSVWGTMPAGEYELEVITSTTEKSPAQTSPAQVQKKTASSGKTTTKQEASQTAVTTNNGNSQSEQIITNMINGNDNDPASSLLNSIRKGTGSSSKKTETTTTKTEKTKTDEDPYAEVKAHLSEILATPGLVNQLTGTQFSSFEELRDFHISNECLVAKVLRLGPVSLDCQTINKTSRNKTEVVIITKTPEELEKEKRDKEARQLSILKAFGMLFVICILIFGSVVYFTMKNMKGDAKTISVRYKQMPVAARPSPAALTAPRAMAIAPASPTPKMIPPAITPRPTIARKPAAPTMFQPEPEPDAQTFLDLMSAMATSADTEQQHHWSNLVRILESTVTGEVEKFSNGVAVEVNNIHKTAATMQISDLIAYAGKPLACVEVWEEKGVTTLLIVPDTQAINMFRETAKKQTALRQLHAVSA